jgi:hypothetical protein
MAFTGNYICNSFKLGLPAGEFNFATGTPDVFKIALYTNEATLDETTSSYFPSGEVSAAGYTAGGEVLTPNLTMVGTGTTGISFIDFNDVSWSGAFTARGALIYKEGGTAICVLDFGADRTSTSTFQVQFPPDTSSSALIRIS